MRDGFVSQSEAEMQRLEHLRRLDELSKPAPIVLDKSSALDVQVSGDHYKNQKIQPIEYIHANNIPFAEGCVIKYVSRWRQKGGIKDLEKARHFLDLLIELETRNAPPHDSLADRVTQQEQA